MASYRITIVELKSGVAGADGIATPFSEVKVFEQQFEDLDVSRFARDINKKPRLRRKSAKLAQA